MQARVPEVFGEKCLLTAIRMIWNAYLKISSFLSFALHAFKLHATSPAAGKSGGDFVALLPASQARKCQAANPTPLHGDCHLPAARKEIIGGTGTWPRFKRLQGRHLTQGLGVSI